MNVKKFRARMEVLVRTVTELTRASVMPDMVESIAKKVNTFFGVLEVIWASNRPLLDQL